MNKQIFAIFTHNKGIFTHILLNVFDLAEKGYDVGVIFESEACKFVGDFEDASYDKWNRLKEKNLVAAVCEACSKAMGTLESAKRQNLPINGDLFGHPPLEHWIKDGYRIMIV
ncbi:MAG: cytoplasmic protein [Candidatus Odinarchaeota archaeon]